MYERMPSATFLTKDVTRDSPGRQALHLARHERHVHSPAGIGHWRSTASFDAHRASNLEATACAACLHASAGGRQREPVRHQRTAINLAVGDQTHRPRVNLIHRADHRDRRAAWRSVRREGQRPGRGPRLYQGKLTWGAARRAPGAT